MRALAFFKRDAKLSLSYPFNFAMQWVSVGISVIGFYFVSQLVPPSKTLGVHGASAGYFAYVVINMAFMTIQSAALASFSSAVRFDQLYGTIESVLATRTSVASLVLGSGLWGICVSGLQGVLYLIVAAVFFGLDLHKTSLASALAVLTVSLLCMAALGVFSAAVVIAFKQTPPSSFLIGGAASLLGGVLFPIALLPRPLQAISWLLPLTHALSGMRGAIAGLGLRELGGDFIWLLVAAALLVPAAFVAFSRAVEHAKMNGTLAHY